MEFGLFTEFHSPPGVTEAAAFDESLAQMKVAEDFGFVGRCGRRPSSSPPPWRRARSASRSGSPSRSCR